MAVRCFPFVTTKSGWVVDDAPVLTWQEPGCAAKLVKRELLLLLLRQRDRCTHMEHLCALVALAVAPPQDYETT